LTWDEASEVHAWHTPEAAGVDVWPSVSSTRDEPLSSQISVEAWLRSDQWELADGGPAG